MRVALIAGALVTLVTLVTLAALVAGVRTYGVPGETQNGGITYGTCGVELWGTPGHFCGDF